MDETRQFFTNVQQFLIDHPDFKGNGVFRFFIKGCGVWFVDLNCKPAQVTQEERLKPDASLEFTSHDVFSKFLNGKLPVKRALLTGKFKIKGNIKLLDQLHRLVSDASKQQEDSKSTPSIETANRKGYTSGRQRTPSYAHSQLATNDLSQLEQSNTKSVESPASFVVNPLGPTWMPDKSTQQCLMCNAKFTFLRRKHHCRTCGGIFCAECSTREISSKRCCDICYERAFGVRTRRLRGFLGTFRELPPPSVSIVQWRKSYKAVPKKSVNVSNKPTAARPTPGTSDVSSDMNRPSDMFKKETTAASIADMDDQMSPNRQVSDTGAVEGEDATVSLNERILKLESTATKLEDAVQCATKPDALHPSVTSVLSRSELLLPFVNMILYVLGRLSWRLGPLICYMSAFFCLLFQIGQSWTLGSSLFTWLYTFPGMELVFWIPSCFGTIWTWVLVIGWSLFGVWITHVATSSSESAELLRRRMRVYGVSIAILADYKLVQLQLDRHYQSSQDDSDFEDSQEDSTEDKKENMSTIEDETEERQDLDDTSSIGSSNGRTNETDTLSLDEIEQAEVWRSVHRRNAQRLFWVIRDLRGLWVKSGQYLSSRPDVMPQEYVRALRQLQDGMPARPLNEVSKTISEDLGKPISSLFRSIDSRALAAASIGQVHRGTLVDTSSVAIKVQHRGMDRIIRQDLINLNHVLELVGMFAPELDIKSVMEEWSKEVSKELDFEHEAYNMEKVRVHMARSGLNVTLPRVIPGMVGPRVLVMRFIDGIKVSDGSALDATGIDRETLVSDICTAYAHQIYINGLFNGDPHPGNILVVRRDQLIRGEPKLEQLLQKHQLRRTDGSIDILKCSKLIQEEKDDDTAALLSLASGPTNQWVPVLLDFGLTKMLSDEMRLAFAQMVVSGEEMDYAGILESFDKMGMKFDRESVAEDMENLQHMFRDAKPADEARRDNAARIKKEKKKRDAEKAAGKSKRKLEAWPSDLMFFLRASELLQGLGSQLNTRHPFMTTMATAARQGLLLRYPTELRATSIVYPPVEFIEVNNEQAHEQLYRPLGPDPKPSIRRTNISSIERRLRQCAHALYDAGAILGLQISMYQDDKSIVDIAAGRMGPLDPRPITPASMFPLYGVSRAFVAVGIQHLIHTKKIDTLDVCVANHWSEFGSHGKDRCTIRELLLCRSGVEGFIPAELTTRHLTVECLDEMIQATAAAEPSLVQFNSLQSQQETFGQTSSQNQESERSLTNIEGFPCGPDASCESIAHLFFGWGWAVSGMFNHIQSGGIQQAMTDLFADSQRLQSEISISKAVDTSGVTTNDESTNVASNNQSVINSRISTVTLGRSGTEFDDSALTNAFNEIEKDASLIYTSTSDLARLPGGVKLGEKNTGTLSSHDDADSINSENAGANVVTMAAAMAAMDFASALSESGLEELRGLSSGGKEHFMDPRILNMEKLRLSELPATNTRSSARALANAVRIFSTRLQTSLSMDTEEPLAIFVCVLRNDTDRRQFAHDLNELLQAIGNPTTPSVDIDSTHAVAYVPVHALVHTYGAEWAQKTLCGQAPRATIDPIVLEACRSYGFRPFTMPIKANTLLQTSTFAHFAAFGMRGLGGTMVVCIPSHQNTVISITLNELSPDGHVSQRIIEQICKLL